MADQTAAIFIVELILLLSLGRLLGEIMGRFGQPAIFGQLLAGVCLGPSLFGALAPELWHTVFPDTPALKSMIDAISQVGILLLLLLTGMETNLALINRRRRAVVTTSVFGIAVPFVCGFALANAMPATLIPDGTSRLVAALFVGTALSISSVKIVAMVLMEVGAIRRDLGQLILATAILDDTIAWILIAVIAGIAAHGGAALSSAAGSIAGTAVFLIVALTIGRRVVAHIIRWSNDTLTSDVPVISAILVVMLVLALVTELIGVHTALGAFVAGILVGQSPILTEHIEGELRGFIIAFFSPVFFAVAGLGMDIKTLFDPSLLALTLAVIAVASIGKFVGALAGGRLGGLTAAESVALATGLNARGSTEVIIASIGLSMGALSNQLYTMIVAMAVVTTMIMPPTLRWMIARVPLREEEARRLEKEAAESGDSVPQMERALVYVDDSGNGAMAARLAGSFAVQRQILVTVMERERASSARGKTRKGLETVDAAAMRAHQTASLEAEPSAGEAPRMSVGELVRAKPNAEDDAVEKELGKGYSIVFAGVERPLVYAEQRFDRELQRVVETFEGPVAIMLNGTRPAPNATGPLDILVPTGGTADARMAIEIALALAKASNGSLTVLHVIDPREDSDLLRGRGRRLGGSILADARQLGKRSAVNVKSMTATNSLPEAAIQRATRGGRFDLVVAGTSLRRGSAKFLGPGSAALARTMDMPVLLIVR